MGVWDDFRQIADKILSRNTPVTEAGRGPCDLGLAGVTGIGDVVRVVGAPKLKEHVSNPVHRDKINRILTTMGKFAVDSAVRESLSGATGGKQIYKVVQEGLKDQPCALSFDDKKKHEGHTLLMEEMQAKMEKMQEDMNNVKQQNKTSTKCATGTEPLKMSNEGVDGSDLLKTDRKRVFIRSRL